MSVTQAPRIRSHAVPLRARPATGRRSAVVGIGAYVPDQVFTNQDVIARGLDSNDEWIVDRTWIRTRHVAPPGTPTYQLASHAARNALEAAGVDAGEVDAIVVATSTPDAPFPSVACRVQQQLGAPGAVAFDVLAACTGFVYALSVADGYIASGMADTCLVIGAETLTKYLDWTDRGTGMLFGDGAGAVVLKAAPEGCGFLSWCLGSDGRGFDKVYIGRDIETGTYTAAETDPKIGQQGPDVFKFATDIFVRQAYAVAEVAGLTMDDIDLWVPHQANGRIIESAARRVGLPLEKIAVSIDHYGNTSTASIPLALKDAVDAGRVHSGDRVLMAGFGSGLTWGACLMQWV